MGNFRSYCLVVIRDDTRRSNLTQIREASWRMGKINMYQ